LQNLAVLFVDFNRQDAYLVDTPQAAMVQIRIARAVTRIPVVVLDQPAQIVEAKEREKYNREELRLRVLSARKGIKVEKEKPKDKNEMPSSEHQAGNIEILYDEEENKDAYVKALDASPRSPEEDLSSWFYCGKT
jgi:hypothetical protein